MSNRVDTRILETCKDYCERLVKVCEAIEGGMYTRNACAKFNINVGRFRSLLRISSSDSYTESDIEVPTDGLMTPQERFLKDLYGTDDFVYVPDDFDEIVDIVLPTLSERESKMIREYYFNEKTFDEIAKMFSISIERVRQLIIKGMRRLRHPSRSIYFKNGVSFYEERNKLYEMRQEYLSSRKKARDILYAEIDGIKSLLKINSDNTTLTDKLSDAGCNTMADVVNNIGVIPNLELTDAEKRDLLTLLSGFCKDEPIPSLTHKDSIDKLGLSDRVYNSLRRAGICTLGDLVKMKLTDLKKVRSLGKKSIDEISCTLEKVGYTLEGE